MDRETRERVFRISERPQIKHMPHIKKVMRDVADAVIWNPKEDDLPGPKFSAHRIEMTNDCNDLMVHGIPDQYPYQGFLTSAYGADGGPGWSLRLGGTFARDTSHVAVLDHHNVVKLVDKYDQRSVVPAVTIAAAVLLSDSLSKFCDRPVPIRLPFLDEVG